MITLLIFLIAQSPTGFHFLDADGKVYIASHEGLYRFDPQGPNLNRFTETHGLPKGKIRFLAYDDGLIWVGTDSGAANGDIRLNDWRVILNQPGHGINFDENYTYLALSGGLYRFEKLTEDITTISEKTGMLILDGDKLLIIGSNQSIYYDINTEELTNFGLPVWLRGNYAIEAENYIGSINTELILKARTDVEWTKYTIPPINDFTVAGDSIIFATDSGLILFDPTIQSIGRYTWPYYGKVNSIDKGGEFLAVATDSGIFEVGTSIKKESRITGLPEDEVVAVHYSGNNLIAVTKNFIAYRSVTGWEWFKREKGVAKKNIIYWDETGTYIAPFNHEIAIRGRMSYDYRKQVLSGNEYVYKDTTIDITANTSLLKGKLSGFYDNTEINRKEYGIGYQSDHLIKRVFYGKDRFGLAHSHLTPTQQGLGVGGEIGGKISVFGYHGKKLSQNHVDIFTGNTDEKEIVIQDSSYQYYRFFSVDTFEHRLEINNLEIYYDDQDSTTNTDRTLENYTIAGRVGDFDLLDPITNYYYDNSNGVLDIKNVAPSGLLAIRYDGSESMLDTTKMLKNRYWLGSAILPHSFKLEINDSLGGTYSISQFGIDNNLDNEVDEAYIDFETGILRFPNSIINDSISYYLNVRYNTRAILYQLSHYPIVMNSEKVYLDGQELRRASDYIIDYSTGIIVILHSELVGPGSEIEVHYEEELDEKETQLKQTGIQLRVKPNEMMKFAPGVYNVYDSEEEKIFEQEKTILTFPFEYRSKIIQLNTEIISNQKSFGGGTELKLKKDGHYLKAKGDFVPDSIEDFGIMQAKVGRWIKKGELGAGLEIHKLKVEGEYQRGMAKDSTAEYHADERIVKMELRPENLPYITMKRGRWESFDSLKNFYRIETGHRLMNIRGRFGLGHEDGVIEVNDIYSELNILNSRFYQRRSETEFYVTDRVELNSLLNIFRGLGLKSNVQIDDLYDKKGYTRFDRGLLLSSDVAPWHLPFILKLGYGINLSGFTAGRLPIVDRNPKGDHLKKEWPILLGFELTSRLLLSSRTIILSIFERQYSTTADRIEIESNDRAEYQLTSNSRLMAQYNLQDGLHNQYIEYERQFGNFILTPGVISNINDIKEVGPRIKIEIIFLPLLRIYNQNETYFSENYQRSVHSLSIQLRPIKPLLLRASGGLTFKTSNETDYSINLRANGLF